MDIFHQNDVFPQVPEWNSTANAEHAASPLGKLTALRLRALAMITSALESELRSIESEVITAGVLDNEDEIDFYEAVDSFQKNLLIATLTLERGSQTRTARRLSLQTSTLNTMIKRYGIDPRIYKSIGAFEAHVSPRS